MSNGQIVTEKDLQASLFNLYAAWGGQGVNNNINIIEPEIQGYHDFLEGVNLDDFDISALQEKYKPLDFNITKSDTGFGEIPSFTITSPTGVKSNIIRHASDPDAKQQFTEFIDANLKYVSKENIENYWKKFNQRREDYVNYQLATNLTSDEITAIENKYSDPNLFQPITQPRKTRLGTSLEPVVLREQHVVQPHEDILQQAFDRLKEEGRTIKTSGYFLGKPWTGKKPIEVTRSQVEDRARKMLITNEKDKKVSEKVHKYWDNLRNSQQNKRKYHTEIAGLSLVDQFKSIGKRYEALDLHNTITRLSEREFLQDQDAENLNSDYDVVELEITNLKKDSNYIAVTKFQNNFENAEYKPNIPEGAHTITFENGKTYASEDVLTYLNQLGTVNDTKNNIDSKLENIRKRTNNLKNAGSKWDLLTRDYNSAAKFMSTLGIGTIDTFGYGPMRFFVDVAANSASKEEEALINKHMETIDVDWHKWKDNIKHHYKRDIEFDDVKIFGENFGTFVAQEFATQIPIIAMILSTGPYAIPAITASVAGTRRGQYEYEEYLNPAVQYSDAYKSLWSMGYGLAEGVFEGISTVPALRLGKKMMAAAGKGDIFRNGVKEYWTANWAESLLAIPVRESLAEGATQITQNWIDERPLFENVDHAMFSGAMFGTMFGHLPFFTGLYMSQFDTFAEREATINRDTEIQRLYQSNADINAKSVLQGKWTQADKTQMKENLNDIKELKQERAAAEKAFIEKYKHLDPKGLKIISNITNQQDDLRVQAKTIANDKTKSKEQRKKEFEELRVKFSELEMARETFINNMDRAYTGYFAMLENSDKKGDKETYARIINAAKKELGDTASEEKINEKAKQIYLGELYDADPIYTTPAGKKILQYTEDWDTSGMGISVAIKDLTKKFNEGYFKGMSKAEFEGIIDNIKAKKQNGFNWGDVSVVIKGIAVANEEIRTGTHEGGHGEFYRILKENEESLEPLANGIIEWVQKNNKPLYYRLLNNVETDAKGNMLHGEVVMNMLAEISSGRFKLDAPKNTGFIGMFSWLFNKSLNDQTKKDVDYNFKGETDAKNFITQFSKKLSDGSFSKQDIKDIRDSRFVNQLTNKQKTQLNNSISDGGFIKRVVDGKSDHSNKTYDKIQSEINSLYSNDFANIEKIEELFAEVIKREALRTRKNGALPFARLPGFDMHAFIEEGLNGINNKTGRMYGINDFIFGAHAFDPKINDNFYMYVYSNLSNRLNDVIKSGKWKIEADVEIVDTGVTTQGETITETEKQTKNEFSDNLNIDKTTTDILYAEVKKIVRGYTPDITKDITRNRKITPIVTLIKNHMAKFGMKPIVTFMGAKKGNKLRNFLETPAVYNKKGTVIKESHKTILLRNMTKTWLANNIPGAILKSIGGKWKLDENGKIWKDKQGRGKFITNYVAHEGWKGKVPDRQKSIKGGPTSGPQYMKRNMDFINHLSSKNFADMFFKPNGDVNQGKQEALGKGISQRVGGETFKYDLQNNGPLTKIYEGRQDLFERTLKDNYREELGKQLDQGLLKNSYSGIRDLSVNELKYFEENLHEVFRRLLLPDNNPSYAIDLEIALKHVFEEHIPKAKLNKIIDQFKKGEEKYLKMVEGYKFYKVKPQSIESYIMDEIEMSNLDRTVAKILGIEGSMTNHMNSQTIKTQREMPLKYAREMVENGMDKKNKILDKKGKEIKDLKEKFNIVIEEVMRVMVALHINHHITSGKVLDGSWFYDQIEKGWRQKATHKLLGVTYNQRYLYFEGMDDYVKNVLNQIHPDVKVITKKSKGKTPKTLITSILNTKTNKELNINKSINTQSIKRGIEISHEDSLNGAEEIRTEIKKYVDWIRDTGYTNVDFGLTLMAMKGFKDGMIRAAANVEFIVDNLEEFGQLIVTKNKKTGETKIVFKPKKGNKLLDYEHLKTSEHVTLKIAEYFLNPKMDIDKVFSTYHVAIVPKTMHEVINVRNKSTMNRGHEEGDIYPARYYNQYTFGNDNIYAIKSKKDGKVYGKPWENASNTIKQNPKIKSYKDIIALQMKDKALNNVRLKNSLTSKGISVIDFDETLATTDSKIHYKIPRRLPNGGFNPAVVGWGAISDTGSLTPTEFAERYDQLQQYGAVFDYSEFNKVIGGKKGPFFNKAKALKEKFGNTDIFILTARPPGAAPAIKAFLKGVGLNIKLQNIIGLQDGRPQAKADWITEKAVEGYNDFLFADDQIKNVKAVKAALDVLDIKGKYYQGKVKLRSSLSDNFNKIIEQTKGVKAAARFSDAAAKSRGRNIGKWKFFIPASAEDFSGLIYYVLGKGKVGEQQKKWFNEVLFKPYARGIRSINTAAQRIAMEYSALKKQHPEITKLLKKETDYNNFTYSTAMRVYIWNKLGMDIPGLAKRDIRSLVKIVESDSQLKFFANQVSELTRLDEGYVEPGKNWLAGTIETDMLDVVRNIKRYEYLAEWIKNKNEIFTKNNLNKLEALFGTVYRDALKDMLWRMENGTNRAKGQNRLVNEFIDWINGAIGNIMFLNMKSALLQSISAVNFVNWTDNNIFSAAKAFANQPQFWKDFLMIFNSDFLSQRRSGLQLDVAANEIANVVATSGTAYDKFKTAMAWLISKGYTPTKIMDSFAIASGGATMYRNRLNTYLNKGMDKKLAQSKAFQDMQEIAEKTQQSARQDLISQQQASVLGRILLAFQNVTMQYNRMGKKAMLDLANRRGDPRENISKIVLYFAVNNMIFNALQHGLFALLFNDEDELEKQQSLNVANSMADTILRGLGVRGVVVSAIKNMVLQTIKQKEKGWRADYAYVVLEGINVSPPIGSKFKKLYSSTQTYKFQSDHINSMGFDIDNPAYDIVSNLLSISLNLPVDRVMSKIDNLRASANSEYEAWVRIATFFGWPLWRLGVDDLNALKSTSKKKKKKKKPMTELEKMDFMERQIN